MKKLLPHEYSAPIWRSILEFDLIEENDKILIGLSGGKDSMFLTYALSIIRQYAPIRFDLAAVTIDPMFTANFDITALERFCSELSIPFFSEPVNIASAIAESGNKSPCFTCAFFRRGAINRIAKEKGFNKIAYAHHHDDAVETFYMELLYSGQLKTFLPKTYLDRTGLTLIRPLLYFREAQLAQSPSLHGYTPVASPCPFNGRTKRQEVKEMLVEMEKSNPGLYAHLASAMRGKETAELWPAAPTREELKAKHMAFWSKGKQN